MSEKDVLALLQRLPRVDKTNYESRAKDFIAVFRGQSNAEQGQRVLSWIQSFCDPLITPHDADKPGTLAFKEGRRWVLAEIMRAFMPDERIAVIESTKRTSKNVRSGD